MTTHTTGITPAGPAPGLHAPLPVEGYRPLGAVDLVLPLGFAAVVRMAIVLAFLGSTPVGDEVSYLRLGREWATSGEYSGIWAPGYPWLVSLVERAAGTHAADALRLVQVGLAVWIGVFVAWIAAMFGGRRTGLAAAWIYAVYLPLATFSALLYSETLFLAAFVPACYHLLRMAREGRLATPWWRPLAAGSFLGLAALTRDSTVLFVVPTFLWVSLVMRGHVAAQPVGRWRLTSWIPGSGPLGLAPAGLVLLSFGAVVLPWTARNASVYDRFVPVGVTAGVNAYLGWNAHDVNHDLVLLGTDNPGELRARMRGHAPEPWTPRYATNRADRARNDIEDGLAFATAHPGYFLRTRVVEAVDLVSPVSYGVRQLRAVDDVGEPLSLPYARRLFGLVSVILWPALALLALWGWAIARDAGPLRSFATMVVLCTASTALVSGLTRLRLPMVPLLIVLAAVWLFGPRERPGALRTTVASVVAVLLLLAWIPSLGPTGLSLAALR